METTLLNKFSNKDSSKKYVWKCNDYVTETSAFFLEYRHPQNVICIPTQFGCPIKCLFCASNDLSFSKNIDSTTITELIDKTLSLSKIDGAFQASFMGQGEPLFNLENLSKAYEHLISKYSKITFGLSTSGIPHLIKSIIAKHPIILNNTKFQISLHSTIEEKRRELIPYSSRYSLEDLFKSAELLARKSGKKICLNYLLFEGVNDSQTELENLERIDPELFYLKLSRYNSLEKSGLKTASEKIFKHFINELEKTGLEIHYFESRGANINAGCGQLCKQYYKK
jgi:23S rRNA (adenine2503-C2)-methyltransferase